MSVVRVEGHVQTRVRPKNHMCTHALDKVTQYTLLYIQPHCDSLCDLQVKRIVGIWRPSKPRPQLVWAIAGFLTALFLGIGFVIAALCMS